MAGNNNDRWQDLIGKAKFEYINWEQRRYEIAKDAMSGLISCPNSGEWYSANPEAVAKSSIEYADELIKQLRK